MIRAWAEGKKRAATLGDRWLGLEAARGRSPPAPLTTRTSGPLWPEGGGDAGKPGGPQRCPPERRGAQNEARPPGAGGCPRGWIWPRNGGFPQTEGLWWTITFARAFRRSPRWGILILGRDSARRPLSERGSVAPQEVCPQGSTVSLSGKTRTAKKAHMADKPSALPAFLRHPQPISRYLYATAELARRAKEVKRRTKVVEGSRGRRRGKSPCTWSAALQMGGRPGAGT